MDERRREKRYDVPEVYRDYITFKVKQGSSDFADIELLDFSRNGIRIKNRHRLSVELKIECLISIPKSLSKEIPFTAKIKYCIQDEDGVNYFIGAEIIQTEDEVWFDLFSRVHDFIKERIGQIF